MPRCCAGLNNFSWTSLSFRSVRTALLLVQLCSVHCVPGICCYRVATCSDSKPWCASLVPLTVLNPLPQYLEIQGSLPHLLCYHQLLLPIVFEAVGIIFGPSCLFWTVREGWVSAHRVCWRNRRRCFTMATENVFSSSCGWLREGLRALQRRVHAQRD